MSKAHESKLTFIPALLEQIADNADRISGLVAEAESGPSIDRMKRETEKLAARNETLLQLIASLIGEEHKHPRAAPQPGQALLY